MSICLPDLASMTNDLHTPDMYGVLIVVASRKCFRLKENEKKKKKFSSLDISSVRFFH